MGTRVEKCATSRVPTAHPCEIADGHTGGKMPYSSVPTAHPGRIAVGTRLIERATIRVPI